MARIRSIHPSHLEDPDIAELSDAAYRLWIGLIQLADDEGRGLADPKVLAARVFMAKKTPEEVLRLMEELNSKLGSLVFYQASGRWYYAFTKWRRWQSPQKPRPSEYPPPEKADFTAPKPERRPVMLFDESGKATGKVTEEYGNGSGTLLNSSGNAPVGVRVGIGIGVGEGKGAGDKPPTPLEVPPPPKGEGGASSPNRDQSLITEDESSKRKVREGYSNGTVILQEASGNSSEQVPKKTRKRSRRKKEDADPRVRLLIEKFHDTIKERRDIVPPINGSVMGPWIKKRLKEWDKKLAEELGKDPEDQEVKEKTLEYFSRAIELFADDENEWVQQTGWDWVAFQRRFGGYMGQARGVIKPKVKGVAIDTRPEDFEGEEGVEL